MQKHQTKKKREIKRGRLRKKGCFCGRDWMTPETANETQSRLFRSRLCLSLQRQAEFCLDKYYNRGNIVQEVFILIHNPQPFDKVRSMEIVFHSSPPSQGKGWFWDARKMTMKIRKKPAANEHQNGIYNTERASITVQILPDSFRLDWSKGEVFLSLGKSSSWGNFTFQ